MDAKEAMRILRKSGQYSDVRLVGGLVFATPTNTYWKGPNTALDKVIEGGWYVCDTLPLVDGVRIALDQQI